MSEIALAFRQLISALQRAGVARPAEIRLADHDQFRRAFLIAAREEALTDADHAGLESESLNWFEVDGIRVTYQGAVDRMIEEARAEIRRGARPVMAGRRFRL